MFIFILAVGTASVRGAELPVTVSPLVLCQSVYGRVGGLRGGRRRVAPRLLSCRWAQRQSGAERSSMVSRWWMLALALAGSALAQRDFGE